MISVKNLTKYYGDFLAVDDLSFEIDEGQVYGFLGPNGAGKSTTMNIIAGTLSPTSGQVKIKDFDIIEQPIEAKKLIGYLPEIPPLYNNETPKEYLEFVGMVKGIAKDNLQKEIDDVIEQVGIANVKNRLISSLSKGYKQRVGIAQAILGKPEVIILDEPTVGLDPIQIIEIRELIKKLGEKHTVILSSHILSEIQSICSKVLIINKGKLVGFDTLENLEKGLKQMANVHLETDAKVVQIKKIMNEVDENLSYVIDNQKDKRVVEIKVDNKDVKKICSNIFNKFADNDYTIYQLTSKKANLEDVFLELTGNEELIQEDEEVTKANQYLDQMLECEEKGEE